MLLIILIAYMPTKIDHSKFGISSLVVDCWWDTSGRWMLSFLTLLKTEFLVSPTFAYYYYYYYQYNVFS
jgi:hypothetical protein